MNIIPPQSGTSFLLKKDQYLKVIDPFGEQVADLFCFNACDLSESLSSGRSIDYNDQIFLTKGHRLYSQRSNPLLEIIEDTCGRHDFLMTPCSLRMFQIVAGNDDYHPSCHENLCNGFSKYAIHPDHISTTFNIFMNVTVSPEGALEILPPKSKAGDYIVFKASTDLVVGLTACSHEGSNNGSFKPIHYQVADIFS
ncbi:urea carboxylase-associated protein [Bdellovibrio sp. ZAP7]|uniref:DUF1989 domain-containing protein n=1 Tax=Bdellovibrio sp. ZAP7 TaxID=2231053 RepID=UPI00115B41F2|nr:urea carboxylase-associated family protein [Bdellovibrio sp. ZAP7]QDK44566.1 urea carboxylase-associated protein [Bdellovibrio sp. ZAP7]